MADDAEELSRSEIDRAELEDYVMYANGIGRVALNLMCLIGVFIFGWLLLIVFGNLGHKGKGWAYLVPILIFLLISRLGGGTGFGVLVLVIYLAGWIHANVILSRYQRLARERVAAIDQDDDPAIDSLLEKGLLFRRVLSDKEAALDAFAAAITLPEGGRTELLVRAGALLARDKQPELASACFDRAMAQSADATEDERIRKIRFRALGGAA